MNPSPFAYKILKNISFSLFGYAWPILFSILITPIVVNKLGIVSYGIYILVNTVTAFLSLSDLGLNVALVKFVAEYNAQNDTKSLRRLLDSARSLYLIVGLVGLTVFTIVGKFSSQLFHISQSTQLHIWPVFLMAGLIFFMTSISSVYVGAITAMQRYDITAKLNVIQLTVFNLVMLGLVTYGFQLKAIFLSNVVISFFIILAYRNYFSKLFPSLHLGYAWDAEEIKKTYRFGILAAITSLASSALVQVDRFVIPIFTGPSMLTYYSLPGNVAQKTYGLVGSLGNVFFPLTSAFSATGDVEKVKNIYKRSFRNFTFVAAGITTAIIAFSYHILFYWLGKDFADRGATILVILALTYFILAVYGPLVNFLLGLGQVKFLMYFSIFLAVCNLGLLLAFVPKFGILGAAWAYLGAVLPIPYAFYWIEQKILGLEGMKKFYLELYGKIFTTSVLLYFIAKFLVIPWVNNIWILVIAGPVTVVMYFVLYKLLGFMEKEDWDTFCFFSGKIKEKFQY